MGPFDIAIIVLCSAAALGIIIRAVWRRVKGKGSGCCGSCSGCPCACNRDRAKK